MSGNNCFLVPAWLYKTVQYSELFWQYSIKISCFKLSNTIRSARERFYSGPGVAGLVALSGSIDVESASGDPSFINLDSTDSKGELVIESSLGCTTDCSTSADCRRGLVNVTSENNQFQV